MFRYVTYIFGGRDRLYLVVDDGHTCSAPKWFHLDVNSSPSCYHFGVISAPKWYHLGVIMGSFFFPEDISHISEHGILWHTSWRWLD